MGSLYAAGIVVQARRKEQEKERKHIVLCLSTDAGRN